MYAIGNGNIADWLFESVRPRRLFSKMKPFGQSFDKKHLHSCMHG